MMIFLKSGTTTKLVASIGTSKTETKTTTSKGNSNWLSKGIPYKKGTSALQTVAASTTPEISSQKTTLTTKNISQQILMSTAISGKKYISTSATKADVDTTLFTTPLESTDISLSDKLSTNGIKTESKPYDEWQVHFSTAAAPYSRTHSISPLPGTATTMTRSVAADILSSGTNHTYTLSGMTKSTAITGSVVLLSGK